MCGVFVSVRGLPLVAAKRGPLFIAVRRPLSIAASLVAEHRLQTRRLSNCGSRAQPLRGMWDLPRPGLEPVSPALAGRFSTTAPPGKPCLGVFVMAPNTVFNFLMNTCFQVEEIRKPQSWQERMLHLLLNGRCWDSAERV